MLNLFYALVTFYDQAIVLQALVITFTVFLALTLFTLQSKWDFSGMGPMYVLQSRLCYLKHYYFNSGINSLLAGIWILLIGGILLPFTDSTELPLAIGGVVIFSGYVIFDTYLIFNRFSPEDYIMASTSLYLDMINLFIRILQILNANQRD